jgi:hypothetical protein
MIARCAEEVILRILFTVLSVDIAGQSSTKIITNAWKMFLNQNVPSV